MKKLALVLLTLGITACASSPEVDVADKVVEPGDFLPIGQWDGAWGCDGGCALPPPALTYATHVILLDTGIPTAVWRQDVSPLTINKQRMAKLSSECWHLESPPQVPDPGLAPFSLCSGYCGGDKCVTAEARWVDKGVVLQAWTFVGL